MNSTRKQLDDLLSFLDTYSVLLNHHSVDFFVADTFHLLPEEWKFLKTEKLQHLLEMASYGRVQKNWPQSLQLFVESSRSLGLQRSPVAPCEAKPLKQLVKIGMDPKKILEVSIMADCIHNLAQEHKVSHIVDLGAGQGYLDQCLAYQYGHAVIGVDDSHIQTKGALKNKQIILRANESKHCTGMLYHINSRVETTDTFVDIVGKIQDYISTPDPSYLLCGLHTCGDLAPSMLRQFVIGDAKVVVNVGCCYNHLTESESMKDSHSVNHHGFPMSQYLTSRQVHLGYSTRMTATQATSRWAKEEQESLTNFTKHAWRAMLQVAILSVDPSLSSQRISVGKLGRKAFKDGFVGYCEAAFEKLKIPLPSKDTLLNIESMYSPRINEVAVFWTLRAMMGEAIESIILLDRYLYLLEHNITCQLVPLFPQKDSPRNIAIIGIK
jgi:hypothetical protein